MIDIVKPTDLKKVSAEAEMAKAKEAMAHLTAQEQARKQLEDEFMQRDLRPNIAELLNQALRRAAERGASSLQVMEFPADFLTDHGRAVNNAEPDWPKTLQGWAARAYTYYEKELVPKGFRMRAEIAEFDKAGRPGKVALHLAW